MLGLKIIAATALLAQGIFAEGVHLLNCRTFVGQGVVQDFVSIVAYCANDADCSNYQYTIPASDACVVSTSSTPEAFNNWEGGPQSCTFPSTGVAFSWDIPSSARSQPNYSWVGTGSNGFRTFNGYKDGGYTGATWNYHSCSRMYYYL